MEPTPTCSRPSTGPRGERGMPIAVVGSLFIGIAEHIVGFP